MATFARAFSAPFLAWPFFVLSFVEADSMRFFADASPCAIPLQLFNCALLWVLFRELFHRFFFRKLFQKGFYALFLHELFTRALL